MPSGDFRTIFLPYYLQKQFAGAYVVLNRNYKPLGFTTGEWVDYASYPIKVKRRGSEPKLAAKLSVPGKTDMDQIFLYNDSTVPTRSKKNMDMYLEKIEVLAKLKLRHK